MPLSKKESPVRPSSPDSPGNLDFPSSPDSPGSPGRLSSADGSAECVSGWDAAKAILRPLVLMIVALSLAAYLFSPGFAAWGVGIPGPDSPGTASSESGTSESGSGESTGSGGSGAASTGVEPSGSASLGTESSGSASQAPGSPASGSQGSGSAATGIEPSKPEAPATGTQEPDSPEPNADLPQKLTVTKTTARPNQREGNGIMGGVPTRITWEAQMGSAEEVLSVSLVYPEGTVLSADSAVVVTVLEGTSRYEVEHTVTIGATIIRIDFSQPVPVGMLLRVEMEQVSLPEAGGDYCLTGTYTDGSKKEISWGTSPAISTIEMTTVQQIVLWLDEQPWVQEWNSILFCKIFLNPQQAVVAVPTLFWGWLSSLGLVLLGFPLAIPVGLGVSFLRMARLRIVRFIASIYVNVIRGTPLFLQIYIAFFGLPLVGIKIDSFLLGVLVLCMNSSAYLAEIFRAGIQSIHKGQFEASASLGMNVAQTMFSVIIPQTVRRVIPTATSEFILLYKDTALLASVGVMEQMYMANGLVSKTGNMTPFIIAAGYYLLVTLPLTRIIALFERRLAALEGNTRAPSAKKDKKKRAKQALKADAAQDAAQAVAYDAAKGVAQGAAQAVTQDAAKGAVQGSAKDAAQGVTQGVAQDAGGIRGAEGGDHE